MTEVNNVPSETKEPQPAGQVVLKTRKPRRSGRLRVLLVAILLAAAAFAAGFAGAELHSQLADDQPSSLLTLGSERDGNTIVSGEEGAIAEVVERVSPSVVSILTTGQSSSPFSVRGQGAGTGVIVSRDGYIMTNRHVVDGASRVSVVTSDGRTHTNVDVIGSDPLNDIAFLQIRDVDDLTPAVIGDSSTLRLGQQVVAIGNALGQYQNSVTSGIVSGLGRPVVAAGPGGSDAEALTDLVQTDAAINSGNSGGPLVNLSGQVIGINTAMSTEGNNIGFAIPINATRGLLEGVLETGEVSRAYLGVQFVGITPEVISEYNLDVRHGALVRSERGSPIVSGGPADRGGVRDGDVITNVNEFTVGEQGGLSSLIGQYRPGDEVRLTVIRDGDERTLTVTLTAYSD